MLRVIITLLMTFVFTLWANPVLADKQARSSSVWLINANSLTMTFTINKYDAKLMLGQSETKQGKKSLIDYITEHFNVNFAQNTCMLVDKKTLISAENISRIQFDYSCTEDIQQIQLLRNHT